MTARNTFQEKTTSSTRSTRGSRRARGFTLIEVLVALALFTILMIIVFVPLTQATRFLAIGRTRASLQQSANGTMTQLQRDLSRAIHVYPNDVLPGVTDAALPYNAQAPYIQGATRVGNTSRLDLLLPELDSTGSVKYPITPARTVVTYYARRLDNALNYDPYTNPVLLYRAQYAYRNGDVNGTLLPTINVSSTRYNDLTSNTVDWLKQSNSASTLQEPEFLETIANVTPTNFVPTSHSLVTPNNVQLVIPMSPTLPNNQPLNGSLKPNTTFNCADSNGDGKIDRVNINLTLMNFNISNRNDGGNDRNEAISGNPNFQRFTLSQVVNLPNIR